jgi:ribulose bisphosphate carboxylase small subunit
MSTKTTLNKRILHPTTEQISALIEQGYDITIRDNERPHMITIYIDGSIEVTYI